MVNGVGHIKKLGKYKRHRSVVTNIPLKTTLPNYNSHNKYNEITYVGSKEPITTETYSIPSNDENDAFCLFLEYFLHLVVESNLMFEPLSPLHVGILLSAELGVVYGTA